MDLIPTSWADAFAAADANPRSRAPLLAIALAIRERYAALGLPNRRQSASIDWDGVREPMPGNAIVFPELGQNQTIERILLSIRDLQGRYHNPHPPYGDRGYSEFPDLLASEYGKASGGGVAPYDALALMPPPGTPLPGDSTASAATRAFYAWARDSINQMSMVVLNWRYVRATVGYDVYQSASDPSNIVSFLGDARRTEGIFSRSAGFSVSGYYDSIGDFYWDTGGGLAEVSIQNPSPLAATARIVLRAGWPQNEWTVEEYSAAINVFDTFGAPGCAGWGPSSAVSASIAPGEWMLVWPDPGAFPVPTAAIPAWPGRHPRGGWQYVSISQDVDFLLDFSGSFRFYDAPATP